jgi:hypothetical protein
VVSGPFANASFAPIVDSDVSAVAAEALLGDRLLGRRGSTHRAPRLHRHRAGRRLRYREVDLAMVRDQLVEASGSVQFAVASIAQHATTLKHPAVVTGDV